MAIDSTARTIAWLRKQGKTAWRTERWDEHAKRRVDLWGFGDVIYFPPITIAQATGAPNLAAHLKKIASIPEAQGWIEAGGRIEVWSWAKRSGRWVPKVIEVKGDNDEEATGSPIVGWSVSRRGLCNQL